ncbi:MAG: DUF3145 family protein [Actinobacteria bacterium]|nr:DUF3145 family protein [Actinomycetota bacterium]
MITLSPIHLGITHGILTIHSAPKSLCSHIDWSLAEVLGVPIKNDWKIQPLLSGTFQCSLNWQAKNGTAAQMATSLAGWNYLRFEIRQDAALGSDGDYFRFTPNLKLHRATIGPSGDVMINENQITAAISKLDSEELAEKLENILGTCWDRELEPFRIAYGEGSIELIDRISV